MMKNKKNLSLPIKVIIIGSIIGFVIAGIGGYKQLDSKRINKERADSALKKSQSVVKVATERLAEIEKELKELKTQYNTKTDECNSIVTGSDGWFEKRNKCLREEQELQSRLWDLESEDKQIKATDYTVYYQEVKPMSYYIFYIIGGSVAVLAALGAFIIYLVKGKKSY